MTKRGERQPRPPTNRGPKEAAIIRIEQNGPEVCSTPVNSNFVLIDVPLIVVGEGPRGEAQYRYRIGAFAGREVPWSLEKQPELVIRLRIPEERFRPGEDLSAEVVEKGSGKVLWKKGWKAGWQGNLPVAEPSPFDRVNSQDEGDPARYYRSNQ